MPPATPDPSRPKKHARMLLLTGIGMVILFGGFLAVPFALRVFALEAFKMPSGSMRPSFEVGDHVFVEKLALRSRAPRRGEAIAFKFPENRAQTFIKRVAAVPGDTLTVKDGHPWLNGWPVPRCVVGEATMPDPDAPAQKHTGTVELEFLEGSAYLTFFDAKNPFPTTDGPYTAKAGEVWVLGDNRHNSHDSPRWFEGKGGGVPLEDVIGRALYRWLPLDRMGVVDVPVLPSWMSPLEPAFQKCLASRPPLEQTIPPSH